MQFEKLIDKKELNEAIEKMGSSISDYYNKDTTLIVLCVLKGSLIFTSDLIRKITLNTNVEFLDISSYKGKERGDIQMKSSISFTVKEKDILIIEDIVDSGNTINHIAKQLKKNNPKSVKIATLLFKPDAYNFDMKIDWIGFNIKNEFVVGYGLDYNELYRNKKSIYKLNEE